MSMEDQFILDSAILDKQKDRLLIFKTQGFPGVESVEGDSLDNIRDLYLNGSSVYSIAQKVSLSEEIVLYYILDSGWDVKRHNMMQAIEDTIIEKIMDTKLKGVEAMTKILNIASDRYIDGIDNYLKTKEEKYLIEVGIKTLKDYKTAVEVLRAFTTPGSSSVNVNLRGAQTVIDKTGGGDIPEPDIVEVNIQTSTIAEIADEKRKNARKKIKYDR